MIEIYGFPSDKVMCPNCRKSVQMCEDKGLEYIFKPIIDDLIGGKFIRNIPNTRELVNRMNWPDTHPINVPQIFAYGSHIGGLGGFKEYCKENNL